MISDNPMILHFRKSFFAAPIFVIPNAMPSRFRENGGFMTFRTLLALPVTVIAWVMLLIGAMFLALADAIGGDA